MTKESAKRSSKNKVLGGTAYTGCKYPCIDRPDEKSVRIARLNSWTLPGLPGWTWFHETPFLQTIAKFLSLQVMEYLASLSTTWAKETLQIANDAMKQIHPDLLIHGTMFSTLSS